MKKKRDQQKNGQQNVIKTTHDLDFEVAPYHLQLVQGITWHQFRVGTCEGLWAANKDTYDILAIKNNQPHNGHLEDVFEWFEFSCKRDKRNLRFLDVINERFKYNLARRGYVATEHDSMTKIFTNENTIR